MYCILLVLYVAGLFVCFFVVFSLCFSFYLTFKSVKIMLFYKVFLLCFCIVLVVNALMYFLFLKKK